MKHLCLLLVLIFLGCKEKGSPTAHTSLKIQWELMETRIDGQDRWLSRLDLINTSDVPVTNTWELFFSFPSGRMIDSVTLNKNGYTSRHWAGGHYSLKPALPSGGILPGDTLQIELPASGSVIKNSDAPSGFYMVFDGNDAGVYLPEVHFIPISKDMVLYKGASKIVPPDPKALYDRYESLPAVEREDLSPITPEPEKWNFIDGTFTLHKDLVVGYVPELEHEGEVLQELILRNTGVSLPLQSGSVNDPGIRLELEDDLMPEEYELLITPGGMVLKGGSPRAVFYGIQSVRGVLVEENNKPSLKAISVKDKPAFAYRGMHLDVARNFSSKEAVLKLLDLMSYYKLNTFHFHLTDDEGWRVEISGLPELTQVGGRRVHTRDEKEGLYHQYGSAVTNSGSGFYTREEYMEILSYAAKRHIEVIPEIDLPGHARAAIVAMKARERKYLQQGDTLAAKAYLLHEAEDRSSYFSVQSFSDNVINVCMPSAYVFIEKVVDEMQQMHVEAGNRLNTMHIGGDEVPDGVWQKSAACMNLLSGREDLADSAKQYFVENVKGILKRKGLRMAGWEEIGLVHGEEGKVINTTLTRTDAPLLYHWNNASAEAENLGLELAAAGYPVVLSHVTNLYFDMAYSSSPEEPGFYWGGFVDTRKVFEFSFPENGSGIRGIQGQLWSEVIDTPEKMEYMVFPKMIAMAERAWRGNTGVAPGTAWSNFAHRLGYFELNRLDKYGSGINYRLPAPGGYINNDTLYLNTAYPGLELRYETGDDPTEKSPLYEEKVHVTGLIKAAAFRSSGKVSRSVVIPVVSQN